MNTLKFTDKIKSLKEEIEKQKKAQLQAWCEEKQYNFTQYEKIRVFYQDSDILEGTFISFEIDDECNIYLNFHRHGEDIHADMSDVRFIVRIEEYHAKEGDIVFVNADVLKERVLLVDNDYKDYCKRFCITETELKDFTYRKATNDEIEEWKKRMHEDNLEYLKSWNKIYYDFKAGDPVIAEIAPDKYVITRFHGIDYGRNETFVDNYGEVEDICSYTLQNCKVYGLKYDMTLRNDMREIANCESWDDLRLFFTNAKYSRKQPVGALMTIYTLEKKDVSYNKEMQEFFKAIWDIAYETGYNNN